MFIVTESPHITSQVSFAAATNLRRVLEGIHEL